MKSTKKVTRFDHLITFLFLWFLNGILIRYALFTFSEIPTKLNYYYLAIYIISIGISTIIATKIYQEHLKSYPTAKIAMIGGMPLFLGITYPDISTKLTSMVIAGTLPPGFRSLILIILYIGPLYILWTKLKH